jgi:hypothetical protein
MGVTEIPAKTINECDGCHKQVEGKNRPKFWTQMTHYRDAYDMQGNACASDNIKLMFCNVCTETFSTVVNEAFKRDD